MSRGPGGPLRGPTGRRYKRLDGPPGAWGVCIDGITFRGCIRDFRHCAKGIRGCIKTNNLALIDWGLAFAFVSSGILIFIGINVPRCLELCEISSLRRFFTVEVFQ